MNRARLLLLLLALPVGAYAEGGCPPGQYPSAPTPQGGVAACYPMPNGGATQPAQPVWSTRWGAFATDATTASLGVATDMQSKRKAKAAAIEACESNGGKKCTVDLTFNNQCAAMVIGEKKMVFKGAPTEEMAVSLAMEDCKSMNSSCKLYQTACSMAARVQ